MKHLLDIWCKINFFKIKLFLFLYSLKIISYVLKGFKGFPQILWENEGIQSKQNYNE